VSVPKNEENAPAGKSVNPRSKRRKDKLIRLDDLIPKQDVKGGRQLLFGASEDNTHNKPNTGKVKCNDGPTLPTQSARQCTAAVHMLP